MICRCGGLQEKFSLFFCLESPLSASEAAGHRQLKRLMCGPAACKTTDEVGCGLEVYAWANAIIYVVFNPLQRCCSVPARSGRRSV